MIALLTAALISLCGSPDFRLREKASRMLWPFVEVSIEQLKEAEADSPDCEIRCRVKPLVDEWYRRHGAENVDELLAPGWNGFPFLFTYQSYGDLRYELYRMYEPEAIKACQGSTEEYRVYRECTRLWMIDRLKARQPCEEILAQMAAEHREWVEHQNVNRASSEPPGPVLILPPEWRK